MDPGQLVHKGRSAKRGALQVKHVSMPNDRQLLRIQFVLFDEHVDSAVLFTSFIVSKPNAYTLPTSNRVSNSMTWILPVSLSCTWMRNRYDIMIHVSSIFMN